jgi:Ca-activated chloride channel family protein
MLMKKNSTCLLLLGLTLLVTGCAPSKSVSSYRPRNAEESHTTIRGKLAGVIENPFIKAKESATSTFSIDADGASYAFTRRVLTREQPYRFYNLRTEELVNYFTYNYDNPAGDTAIAVNGEVSDCPWAKHHKLIRIGIKGKPFARNDYPPANFVLLIDVSGSMAPEDKLGLLKNGFIDFVHQMRPVDRLAIVTYSGYESIALESTPGTEKEKMINAIQALKADGLTNGSKGITMAYEIAQKNFIPKGNNRIILGTDGDFNVGLTSTNDLVKLVEEEREKGVFLTTLGVGAEVVNEDMMEKIANKGNGNYEYLDSKEELNKVFIDDYSKFLTVAKDVKVQVAFNSNVVKEYRLIGYENRLMENKQFEDNSADAGEIGAAQTITAIYEIVPTRSAVNKTLPAFTIHFRYKNPGGGTSIPLDLPVYDTGNSFKSASENMRFAASVAALGLYLRNSEYKGKITLNKIKSWSKEAMSFDPNGYRARHMSLLEKAPAE